MKKIPKLCSFCGDDETKVEGLIARAPVYICFDCVLNCIPVIAYVRRKRSGNANAQLATFVPFDKEVQELIDLPATTNSKGGE